MEISSLRMNLPLSLPGRQMMGGPGINSPSGLLSPKTPTACAPLSSRVFKTSATFSYRTGEHQRVREKEKERERDFVFKNKNKNHYYALLGVPCDASQEDIRVAYRRLALQYHPDVLPLHQLDTATKFFSDINTAYDTLTDPHKRQAYDDLHLLPKLYNGRAGGLSTSPLTGQWRSGRNWETDQCWC